MAVARTKLPDNRNMLDTMVSRLKFRTGFQVDANKPIKDGQTFRQWCEQLGRDGLKVDGHAFALDDRPAMAWIYDQIPSTEDEAYKLVLVLMKCAQVGFTVMEMLAVIYLGLRFGPATVGMFLPDMNLAGLKSSERFMPIVRSAPKVHEMMTQDSADGSGTKKGEGNVRTRRIGDAMFVFSWTSGRATTESIPIDILSFDEVQEMTLEQMEKTIERLSASDIRFVLMGSTANWPDADIHHWFKRGSQHRFRTRCPHCGEAHPLDDYFPSCIRYDADAGIYRYVCKVCGGTLRDTQDGEWVAERPELDPPVDLSVPKRDRPWRYRSIHFPQFLSPTISAGDIMSSYQTATDMKNFYNRKLGKPYLDPSQVPVTMEHLNECVRLGKEAGVVWKQRARGAFMGVDQMGNYNVVVIKERLADGRQAVIHVEEIYSADPFSRCSDLMEAFGIAVAVVEINPNYNDAKRFANRHRGKVFICDSFGTVAEGMIHWGDTPKLDTSDRRTSEDERDRYTLKMDQYKCMQVSMARITGTQSIPPSCLFPDPQGLVQDVVDKGVTQLAPVLPRAFVHFTKTALVAEKDEETNKFKRSVKKVGIDPHFSYANMLCDVAWARSHGTSMFIVPSGADVEAAKMRDDLITQSVVDLPPAVVDMLTHQTPDETCSKCAMFENGQCMEHGIRVKPEASICEFFSAG